MVYELRGLYKSREEDVPWGNRRMCHGAIVLVLHLGLGLGRRDAGGEEGTLVEVPQN
jgi:hypothetical protein